MPIQRYYFADSIEGFFRHKDSEILAELDRGSRQFLTLFGSQGRAWDKEIVDLKAFLGRYIGRGSIVFEYTIPRLGKRIDVVLIIDGIVFILEYKAFKDEFQSADAIQVFDYALDLKNFHKESEHRYIVPILIMTDAEARENSLVEYRSQMFAPLFCNTQTLPETIEYCLNNIPRIKTSSDIDWLHSRYEPTPNIIEAVTYMYKTHSVKEISRKGAEEDDFNRTCECVNRIIAESKEKGQKSICFVTGVPGAGKTLVGMNIATKYLEDTGRAVYLSGNGPLVDVLCEALARDMVERSKEEVKSKKLNGEITKAKTKKEALSDVQAVIQMVHRYRSACLENVKEIDGRIVEDVENRKSKSSNYVPVDHVAIFDEAQRAWTKRGLAKFMKEKHGWDEFPFSEPEFLISCLDRHNDWGVVVCLVGGGQEINHDEAGIGEWIDALNRSFPDWHVYIGSNLYDKEYMAGEALAQLEEHHENVHPMNDLHLSVSRRSFKAERLAAFVKALLDIEIDTAKKELAQLKDYPIYVTRDLDKAKNKLREFAHGSNDRYGLLVSSKAERLKPLAIDVRVKPSVIAYFLNGPEDIRSSLFLEDAVSEFDVQGLELDWSCLIWDADFRYSPEGWVQKKLSSKTVDGKSIMYWQNINDLDLRAYQLNAYRVLLTRARQGMIICVPTGDIDVPPRDSTRLPEYYDCTYNYLKSLGLEEL